MTTVRAGLIQFGLNTSTEESPEAIKANMTEAHLAADRQGGRERRPDPVPAGGL